MPKRNIRKILFGVFLMVFAGFAVLTAFYQSNVKPDIQTKEKVKAIRIEANSKKVQRRAEAIQKQMSKGKTVATLQQQELSESPQITRADKSINLERLVKAAQEIYGQAEQQKRQGYLWIDRKNSKYVVTLGAVNGVLAGSRLSVFDGQNKLGEITVETAFDVISYVFSTGDRLGT